MLRLVKSLPNSVEIGIVLVLSFGDFVVASLSVALHHVTPHYDVRRLIFLVVFEIAILAVLFPFLRARGWTLEKIGFRPTFPGIGIGFLLFLAAYAAAAIAWYAIWLITPETALRQLGARVIAKPIPLPVSLAVGLVNPFFEEVWVCGYLMTVLKRSHNPWLAISASVVLRVLYHLYQGARGVLSITPVGLIFGVWYARTGRLWPLIVAHSVADLLALLMVGH